MILNTGFIKVDGRSYQVGVISITRKAQILDRYAERTEDGDLNREVIGTYYNYEAKFGNSVGSPDDYDALFEVLSSPEEYHTIMVPYGKNGSLTFIAYISNVSDSVLKIRGSDAYWSGLTANFIAKTPART